MAANTEGFIAEYEFYQFRAPIDHNVPTSERNSSSTARFLQENPVNSLPPLTEGMFGYSLTRPVHNQDYYYDIFNACERFRCDVEGWHTESGPGVFEAVWQPSSPLFLKIHANQHAGFRIWGNPRDGRQSWVIQVGKPRPR